MAARRRKLRSTWPILLIGLTVALVSFVEIQRSRPLWIDGLAMNAERDVRFRLWRLGLPQPGAPDPARYNARLANAGVAPGSAVFVRVFKQDSELEVWMQHGSRFNLVTTYPICRWSGDLGPKHREGDKQSPEGIYTVSRAQLNPNSRQHLSFNIGFPNRFDRAHDRTGSFIMVHGGCSSVGCFAITDKLVDDLWRTIVAAFDGGQKRFQIQIFPFRMTEQNFRLHASSQDSQFWRDLKPAYDLFEHQRVPPAVTVCSKRYRIDPGAIGADGSEKIVENCPTELAASPPSGAS